MARSSLLPGTLDMLILRTLGNGSRHGHGISTYLLEVTKGVLRVEHGSLYPALHRLERQGWIASQWELAAEAKREHRYYRLTAAGRQQLRREAAHWQQLTTAIARVMEPAEE